MVKISKVINKLLISLVKGDLYVLKNDYEKVSSNICQTATQFLHLSVLQSKLIHDQSDFTI